MIAAHPHRLLTLAAGAALALAGGPAAPHAGAATIDPAVRDALDHSAPTDTLDTIVVLRRQAGPPATHGASRHARLAGAIDALQGVADAEQRPLRARLAQLRRQGGVERIRPFWIIDGLELAATPDVIREVAARPEVAEIRPNATIAAPSAPADALAAEWNVARVGAPALWSLGLRGQGVVVASMDTGVDVTHPDLASRWRGGANSWYDPNGQHPTTPTDVSGHGTWTMGAMVGGDAGGSAVGMAPDARWIAVKIFNDRGAATTAGIHAGFQWLLDPDHNPATADAPNVVVDAWTFTNGGCDLSFQPDLRNLRAAGILPVFAAGNGGPLAATSYSPANNPEAFAVGGTDAADAVDPGSSRGPSSCGAGTWPQLVAPGVDVRTTDLYGLYASVTGTSIAAPQVGGALALLLGAFPNTDADRQAAALQSSAVDLGPPGPDDDSGAGRLDAAAAYDWLATAPDFGVTAAPASATAAPGGATVTYDIDVGTRNGFGGDVVLSLTGLSASQASWSATPAAVTGGSGTAQVTVTTSPSLAPGTYPLTIRGTSGAVTHSAVVTLVIPAPPDFTLTATPSSRSTTPGGSAIYTVSAAASGGFSGSVALSASGLPAQTTATFSRNPLTAPGTATVTLRTARTTPRGTYAVTIRGRGGALDHGTPVTLVVR